MRASSGLKVFLALTTTLVAGTDVLAHRSDDCLQAARIGLEPDRVLFTLDLTPGLELADSFLAELDHDGNGSLSAEEQRGYALQMLSALELELDQRPLQPRLLSWTFPELSAFRRGEGAMRLEIQAGLPRASAGSHRLFFRNRHRAGHSAYLANALVPESARLAVTAQRRDPDQSELTIEYTVQSDSTGTALAWALSGLAAAFLIARLRPLAEGSMPPFVPKLRKGA